jgi:hypothetical protein
MAPAGSADFSSGPSRRGVLRAIYADELKRLDGYAREHRPA